MKLPNFLIHTFAAVGVISLIFWSCAAADSDNIDNIDNPPQISSSVGKYQVSDFGTTSMVILNTETGVLKSYYFDYEQGGGNNWYEYGTNVLVGVDGNLTVTH